MTKVRTRFAPSPTGRMHVGNLRTALYEFLIAKHAGGDFILRIEDTDRERLVEGAVDIIYRTMAETGLVHDEGPDKDKGFGPYVQSERQASGLYLEYAKKLIESGDAYYCFCDKERLESLKTSVGEDGKEITVYDKHCLHLSKEEIQANLDAGKPYVIRINMPTEGTTTNTFNQEQESTENVSAADESTTPHIDLKNKKIKMGKKEKLRLRVKTIGLSNKLKFKSSNKKVVSVTRKGKLKAKKKGKAIITIYGEKGITAVCKVTVKKAPKSIVFKKKPSVMKVGDTFKLKTKLSNKSAGSVKFISKNKKVIKVSKDGMVKALRKGKAEISARTYNRKEARIIITVK